MAVARRPIDGDTRCHQSLAGGVNVINEKCQMAERTTHRVGFCRLSIVRPVPCQLQQRRLLGTRVDLVVRSGQEDQREAPGRVVDPAYLDQAQVIAPESQCRIEIKDP